MKKFFVGGLVTVALGTAATGVFATMRSPLFLARVVEVTDLPTRAPVDAQRIADLAEIPVDKVSLFDLNLQAVEKRILRNPWIRDAVIQKRFPQTISISVTFREPLALIPTSGGGLSYVDSDGRVFGRIDLRTQPDLPVLNGFIKEGEKQIPAAIALIRAWDASPLHALAPLSAISWDDERGFRVLTTYELNKVGAPAASGRAWVELGQEFGGPANANLDYLTQVFTYLSRNGLLARQIFADAGKKIVVKTAHGS